MYHGDNKKKNFSDWLEVLQQESWQLELLISGFAIFGLFAARPVINEMTSNIMINGNANIAPVFILAMTLPLAWIIFTSNLIIHVFVRGLWIGAIGLRYVSGDIDYESLRYNSRFTTYYKKKIGSFDDYIERLERISSVIFSLTFLMFFIMLSFLLFVAILAAFAIITGHIFGDVNTASGGFTINFEENKITGIIISIIIMTFLFMGIFVFIDFITFGFFKKRKSRWFSWFYLKVYRFFSFITLSFMWRPLYLNFLDQKFTKKTLILAFPYSMVLTILLPNMTLIGSSYTPDFSRAADQGDDITNGAFYFNHYDDERIKHMDNNNTKRIDHVSIPSKLISRKSFQFFVNFHEIDEKLLSEKKNVEPIYNKGLHTIFTTKDHEQTSLSAEENLDSIRTTMQNYLSVRLNDQDMNSDKIQCRFYQHPNKLEKGLLCFFSLDTLPDGLHDFNITCDRFNVTIPFIYEYR